MRNIRVIVAVASFLSSLYCNGFVSYNDILGKMQLPKHQMIRPKTLTMKSSINDQFPLQNDLILRVARGEKVDRTPVWLFRQAGRHLPEYNQYKTDRGKNFLELLKDPIDVTEVTLQPLRRYTLDAAILFSDILVIAEALGLEITMPGGKGILVPKPLKDPEDMELRIPHSIDVSVRLSHVLSAVTKIKEELKGSVPLIGFSAAPWTLMFYMVGGSSKKNTEEGIRWLNQHPLASSKLLDLLTNVVIDYLEAQVHAGADILQVFEAMGEFITEDLFETYAMPCLARIAFELKQRCPNTPLMVFPRGCSYALQKLSEAGYHVLTIDTKTDRISAKNMLANQAADKKRTIILQGNLNPAILIRREDISIEHQKEEVNREVMALLNDIGPNGLIANLGEGLGGAECPELVAHLVDTVHELSAELYLKSG